MISSAMALKELGLFEPRQKFSLASAKFYGAGQLVGPPTVTGAICDVKMTATD